MKTFRHLLLLLVLVGGTMLGKAQCGIDADFYQNLNPNQVPWFHDTSRVDNGWQITSYYWSFGDGSTSNLMNPTHVFPHPGAYNVCHYIVGTNNNGGSCVDSVCRLIQIGCTNMVYANITASVQGNIVVYTGTGSSNYPPLTYAWYFPGGQPTTSSTPVTTVQYTSPGSHQACLTVADSNGCSTTICQTVTTTGCTQNIDANFNTSVNANPVVFETTNSYYYQETQWDFGDGTTSTDTSSHITHTYPSTPNATTYNVCHYLNIIGTTCRDTVCKAVVVPGSSNCGTVNFTSTYNGNATVLTATNTGSGNFFYTWKIKNNAGTTVLTGSTNPFSITSLAGGTYNACVFLYNSNQQLCDSLCQTITVQTQQPCVGAVANFTYTLNNTVIYLNAGTNYPSGTSFQWWLDGQATGIAPTFQQYNYTALSPGTHQICLYVYSNNGQMFCDSACQTITVISSTCGTVAFTSAQSGGMTVLTATTTGSGTLYYNWRIRNSAGTTLQTGSGNPFTVAPTMPSGVYQACVYLYNNNQQLCDSSCQNVTLCNLSVQIIDSGIVPGTSNRRLTAFSNEQNVIYVWSDASTTQSIDAMQGGTYCVTVSSTNANCTASTCSNVPACGNASFTASQTNAGLVLTGYNSGNGGVYGWSIRTLNGTVVQTGSGNPYTATGLANGTYSVCLILYNNNQTVCDDTCMNVAVTNVNPCNGLNADWTQTYNTNNSVTFTSTNQLSGATYHWNFGDGHDSNLANPTHSYATGGLYNVCLIVNIPGTVCADTFCNNIQASGVTCNVSANITATALNNGGYELAAQYTGGTALTYSWSNGITTAGFVATTPGTYCVTVTGTNNCSASACYTYASTCGTASLSATVQNNIISATSTSIGINANTHYYWNVWGSNNNLIQTQSGTNSTFTSQQLPTGTYLVCLYLYGSNSTTFCDSACITVTISGQVNCSNLNAEWTNTYVQGNGVRFIGVSNANTITHLWTFGDGTTSTNADPTHYYTSAGLYEVCHIVAIPGTVCRDTFCHNIQANAGNPCAGFSVNINHVVSPNSNATGLQAVATSSSTTTYYNWSNGATTQTIYPTTAGVYCVTAYNSSQCTATDCDTITANTPACQAAFSYGFINCNTIQFANASTGGYTNVVWYFGDGTTSSASNPVHSFAAGTYTVQLTVYTNGGNCQSSYYSVVTVQPCGVYDTICGVVFNDINGNGVQNNGEAGLSGGVIYAGNYSAQVNANGEYHLVLPAGTYTLYYCAPSGYSFTVPVGTQNPNSNTVNCASYTISTQGGQHCGYNFGVQNNSVNICGIVYNDANNNQQRENTENGIANVHVVLTGSNGTVYHAYTNQSGNYCVTLPAGTYTITIVSPIGGTITPGSITITTTAGNSYGNNNFGVYTQPGSCNLGVYITPHTTVTPGFEAWYDVRVCNVGASNSTGTVSLFYDQALVFDHSSPAQSSVNASTRTVSWNFSNLAPGACRNYWVVFDASTTVTVGQHIFMLANVTTTNCNETDFTNNVDTVHQDATASWDPNNKLVLPAGEGIDGNIQGNEELTYTINFQNTGNAPAVNVVLHDEIDQNLDLATFKMLGASHDYSLQFEGRKAIWKFSGIMLPDSTTNEAESHGHVTFAIKPAEGLAEGTRLNNTADIYFDYNAAVVTNTTVNTIDYKLSVEDLQNNVNITLMPNPFKDYTTIRVEGGNTSYQLRIFDMMGQVVKQDVTTNNVFTIQRGSMAAGVYMYEISNNNKVIGKGKMIAAD